MRVGSKFPDISVKAINADGDEVEAEADHLSW